MRTTHLVIGFSSLAIVIGSTAMGCSSSSSKAPAGTVSDAATEDGGEDTGAATCTATTDAGSLATYVAPAGPADAGVNGTTLWECEKAACSAEVTACAADSCCNALILNGFSCLAVMGVSAEVVCFAPAIESSDPAVTAMVNCLTTKASSCGIVLPDGGADGAATTADTGTASDTGTGAETSASTDAATGG